MKTKQTKFRQTKRSYIALVEKLKASNKFVIAKHPFPSSRKTIIEFVEAWEVGQLSGGN